MQLQLRISLHVEARYPQIAESQTQNSRLPPRVSTETNDSRIWELVTTSYNSHWRKKKTEPRQKPMDAEGREEKPEMYLLMFFRESRTTATMPHQSGEAF